MAFIKKIKKRNSVYFVEVESYREDGKVSDIEDIKKKGKGFKR